MLSVTSVKAYANTHQLCPDSSGLSHHTHYGCESKVACFCSPLSPLSLTSFKGVTSIIF